MSGGKHGMGSLLQDEQDLDNDMFDIFSSPQGDVHMEKGKTQEILLPLPTHSKQVTMALQAKNISTLTR